MRSIENIKKTPNLQIVMEEKNFNEQIKNYIAGRYFDKYSNKWLNFVFSVDYDTWEHLSVSTHNKIPTWEQMCVMKDIFFDEEEECVEFHPKKSEYVNLHPYCLHIWREKNGRLFSPYDIQHNS